MMAPASGSGRWPAWMARVPKPAARSSSNTRVIPLLNSWKYSTKIIGNCLIVDDEPRLRQVLVHLMRADGFTCFEASNGIDALAQLAVTDMMLVLSDLRMPKMGGIELLRELRMLYPDIAVVMITAVADVEVAVNCLVVGRDRTT